MTVGLGGSSSVGLPAGFASKSHITLPSATFPTLFSFPTSSSNLQLACELLFGIERPSSGHPSPAKTRLDCSTESLAIHLPYSPAHRTSRTNIILECCCCHPRPHFAFPATLNATWNNVRRPPFDPLTRQTLPDSFSPLILRICYLL